MAAVTVERAPTPALPLEPAPAPLLPLERAPTPVLPLEPAPVPDLVPAPVLPLEPAPVPDSVPARVLPLEPAPVPDSVPAPVLPLEPAPVPDSVPAPVLPLEPAPAPEPAPTPEPAPAPDPVLPLEPAPAPDPLAAPVLPLEPAPAPDPVPAPAPAPARAQGGNDDDGVNVLALLGLRDQMKAQLTEYNEAVHASQENFIDKLRINGIEETLVQGAMKDLQNSIDDVKVSLHNKTLALQRIQILGALRKKLQQEDEESRLILETMKQIGLLGRTLIHYQQQAHQKEEEMIDIKRKRVSLKVDKGQKLQQVHTTMKTQEEKQASVNVTKTKHRPNKLERERQMTTIIQNVLQNIIIGSRVNWAEDPSLKEIVLELENNVSSVCQEMDMLLFSV